MKRLTYLVVILALIYGGYWFAGSTALENGLKAELDKMAAGGWQVEYETLDTRGFPSRFDTTVTDITIGTPDGSLGYQAAMVQALALSYKPNRVIAVFPETQQLTLQGLPLTVTSDGLRASLNVGANAALSLQDLTAEAKSIALSVGSDHALGLENLIAALRESSDASNTYATFFSADEIQLSEQLRAQLDPQGSLPATIEIAKLNAAITLDRPLDRHTLPAWEADPGHVRGLAVQELQVKWGAFEIRGDGAMIVAEDGTPDGTITLRLNDWKGVLALVQDAGVIPTQYAFIAQSVGQTLSGGASDMVLPITVQNGNLSVGPLPLGPAPKFQ